MQEVEEARACLKKAFCKMCVTICGRFRPDEGAVAGYGNRIRVKSPAKWDVQIAGMIFQTRAKDNFRNISMNYHGRDGYYWKNLLKKQLKFCINFRKIILTNRPLKAIINSR